MQPSIDDRRVQAPRTGAMTARSTGAACCVALSLAPWLAACATAPPSTALPHADGAGRAATILGPLSRDGCFRVAREGPAKYRFVIDDVVYPTGLGAGHVAIFVNAGGLVDLKPRPIALPRRPRLEFSAEGEARGAFELWLSLVDTNGRESEPTWMNTICSTR